MIFVLFVAACVYILFCVGLVWVCLILLCYSIDFVGVVSVCLGVMCFSCCVFSFDYGGSGGFGCVVVICVHWCVG